jgi:hypothetical protein
LMSGMCGIRPPFQGLRLFRPLFPGRCPGLEWVCPVGADHEIPESAMQGRQSKAPTGRSNPSLGQRPRTIVPHQFQALKGRSNRARWMWDWVAPSGLAGFWISNPGRCPGLGLECPVGAGIGAPP